MKIDNGSHSRVCSVLLFLAHFVKWNQLNIVPMNDGMIMYLYFFQIVVYSRCIVNVEYVFKFSFKSVTS